MAKKSTPTAASASKAIQNKVANSLAANAGNTSYSSSTTNTGEMSTSVQRTGATGAAVNTTNIVQKGDPGFSLGQDTDVITTMRRLMGL